MFNIIDSFYSARALVLFVIIIFISCKKNVIPNPAVGSLTVTNAVVNGKSIRVNNIVSQVANNAASQLNLPVGENNLYAWPVDDSLNPYYVSPKFNVEDRAIYSFFLAGQSPNITGILLKDDLPYHSDSTCGVRFINLCPNSTPFNITLSTTPAVNEVSNLVYLQYTGFMLYPAKATNTSYSIQVRRASDNTVLITYSLNTPRFTNVTLVIRGMVNTNPALSTLAITRVNNDR